MKVYRPIAGFEPEYAISEDGDVLSLSRNVIRSNGVPMTIPERVLHPTLINGHRCVTLMRKCRRYHRSVESLRRQAWPDET